LGRGRFVSAVRGLGGRLVRGVFRIDDIDMALQRIAAELHLKTVQFSPLLTVLHSAQKSAR
jgi:ferric-dicitrate binding protein FerR (iron transport regulator)